MRNNEISDAIKKIREDCALHGFSKNHLAKPLRKHGYSVVVTQDESKKVVKQYRVTPEEIASGREQLS